MQGRATPERLNAFRNVGRLMGLCLLQNELCPLFFNRHVIKHLLSRKVRFHDLAFFDPVIYESLRQLVVDAENKVSKPTSLLAKNVTKFKKLEGMVFSNTGIFIIVLDLYPYLGNLCSIICGSGTYVFH